MNTLAKVLSSVAIGNPQSRDNMSVYPLKVPNGHQRRYHTLDEALKAKTFEVKEVSEGGAVPILTVNNTGALPVLLVIGEELIGAKQNRVLNTSLLVPTGASMPIPVSCVEAGRWAYRTAEFGSGDSTSHFYLRKAQTENVTRNLRMKTASLDETQTAPIMERARMYDAEQGEVWAEVSRKMSAHSTTSSTRALHDVYEQTGPLVTEYLESFHAPEAEGILVTIDGQIMGVDLFDHHDTLKALWNKLLRGYALDAVERKTTQSMRAEKSAEPPPPAPTIDQAQLTAFLQAAQAAEPEAYDAIGIGKDLRVSTEQVSGSSLLWEDRLVHTSLFNARAKHG